MTMEHDGRPHVWFKIKRRGAESISASSNKHLLSAIATGRCQAVMASIKKQEDPVNPVFSNDTLESPADSTVDLEKAETVHQVPASGTGATVSRSRSKATRTRSIATDGYSAYNLDEKAEDDGDTSDVTTKRTKPRPDPYEVQWDGPDHKANPRNFNLAKKWLIVIITSFASSCV